MRFQLLTLVDITQTDARRGDQTMSYKQQQNFFSVLQTISLRANPVVDSVPVVERKNTKGLGFGSNFVGEHAVWCLPFVFETAGSHSIEFLKQDFNMVPFIAGLAETAKFKELAFCTDDPKKTNIVFVQLE
jgi:hypothetical protein